MVNFHKYKKNYYLLFSYLNKFMNLNHLCGNKNDVKWKNDIWHKKVKIDKEGIDFKYIVL